MLAAAIRLTMFNRYFSFFNRYLAPEGEEDQPDD